MHRLHGMKVIVLTRGDLARVADEKDGKASYSDKLCRDVQLNRKKSAEAIVLLRKCERKKKHGLAALCHKTERRIRMEACCPKRLTGRHMKFAGRAKQWQALR